MPRTAAIIGTARGALCRRGAQIRNTSRGLHKVTGYYVYRLKTSSPSTSSTLSRVCRCLGSCLAVRRRDAPPRGREGVVTGRRLQPRT